MTTISYASNMTEDLITEILLRLPVIALLRCKSVCKKWLSIINGTHFAYNHFHQRNHTYALVCCAKYVVRDRYQYIDQSRYPIYSVILFPTETLERHVDLDTSIFPMAITDVCGPSNGIFCVRFENHDLALWNPATRRMWSLPADFQPPRKHYQYSFWVDPFTNEFKIFLIKRHKFFMYTSCDDSLRCYEGEETLLKFGDSVPHFHSFRYTVSNGFCYFLKLKSWDRYYAIVAFDHFNNLFQEIQMPEKIKFDRRMAYLDLYDDDSLALFSVDWKISGDDGKHCVEIWLMKEKGCWTKLYNLAVEPPNCVVKPVGFWKRNELFINEINKLMIHDTLSGKTRKVEVETLAHDPGSFFSPFCYKESIFLS